MARRGRACVQAGVMLALTACIGPRDYGARGHPQQVEPASVPSTQLLVSAHVSRFGDEPPPLLETTQPRMVEGSERELDRLLLVFAVELDPLTIDARSFGVLRADGRRVRPVRAFLAPADEGDENRSLTLIGNFGSAAAPPVAIHILGSLYAESGEDLRGLDAGISPPSEPDRPVVTERLSSNPSRCPGAAQVVRTHWSDVLRQVGADDLAGIELRLADGRTLAPSDFDDQASRSEDPPCEQPFTACLGPADDNVLDLCVDAEAAVVHVRFAAGLFTDEGGQPSAAADVDLNPPPGARS